MRPIYNIAAIVAGMRMHGADKSCSIKRPSADSLTGVTIVFVGAIAIDALMPHMLRFVERVNNPELSPFPIDPQACLDCLDEMMERRGIRAMSVTYTESNPVVQVWIFNGDQICREVCEMLDAHGIGYDPRQLEPASEPSTEVG